MVYDAKLINLKNRRNRAYKKLLNKTINYGDADPTLFLEAKTKFEEYQDELYNAFLKNLASNYKKQPKKFWNYINSKYKRNVLPGKVFYNDESATTDNEKANLFAKFFATVYQAHENDIKDDIDLLSFIN